MKNNKRRLTDKSGAAEEGGHFENLRIKVNSRSYFRNCAFYNCTFVGKAKNKSVFLNCFNS